MNFPRLPMPLAAFACGVLATFLPLPMAAGQTPAPTPTARRVVLVVWDGLRPDSINDEATPTLARLAHEGVFFTRHHPVYPSMTEVNGTALATGCYPAHSGIIGNLEYRPAINPLKNSSMEHMSTIRKGDALTGGKYLRVPTLPELLQSAGRRTAVAGTKGVVALFDRADRKTADSVLVYGGETLPADYPGLTPFPTEVHYPNVEQDAWTTDVLVHSLWSSRPEGVPSFSVLWMSDPDYTQHRYGPDSPQAHRALASVDADLAKVLAGLEAAGVRADTDVLVVSDHGFSTIGRQIDLAQNLNTAGFHAAREYTTPPQRGDIVVDGLNGTVFLYVGGHDADTIRRAVAFLQAGGDAGVIFTRDALPGTFALSVAHIDSPDAPDIVVAFRWNDDKNASGFPGEIVSDGGRKPGQGTHATLSRYDMHNTLVAAGPDFKAGWRDELPSGNVDLAPTIAHLLGLPKPSSMDGRVLAEALSAPPGDAPAPPRTERLEAKTANWQQYLQITHHDGVDYFDEGNFVENASPQATQTR